MVSMWKQTVETATLQIYSYVLNSSDIELGLNLNVQTGGKKDYFNHYNHFLINKQSIEAKPSSLKGTHLVRRPTTEGQEGRNPFLT